MTDEVDNDWLEAASPKEQKEAMRRWFLRRYEDPANETPWDGEDKAYIFVWGGPYDPNDVIQERFGDYVPYDVMWELIQHLWSDVGDKWAPIEHEGADYAEHLRTLIAYRRDDPHLFLMDRIAQIDQVVHSVDANGAQIHVLHQMAHGSLIAALEAYLSDTFLYWIGREESAFRRFVSTNKDFQKRTLALSDLFARLDSLKEEVQNYLTDLMWHNLPKVKALMVSALEIEVPAIDGLVKEVIRRHDIVHRAGRSKDGVVTEVTRDDLALLEKMITDFVQAIEVELVRRFPPTVEDDPLLF